MRMHSVLSGVAISICFFTLDPAICWRPLNRPHFMPFTFQGFQGMTLYIESSRFQPCFSAVCQNNFQFRSDLRDISYRKFTFSRFARGRLLDFYLWIDFKAFNRIGNYVQCVSYLVEQNCPLSEHANFSQTSGLSRAISGSKPSPLRSAYPCFGNWLFCQLWSCDGHAF